MLIRSACRLAPALLRDRSGSPGMEFALVAPIMFTILAGTYDVTQLLIAMRRVTSAAQEIVQIATEQAVQPDQTNALTVQQANQAMTAIYAMMPGLKATVYTSQYSATLSSVVFTTVPPGCAAGNNCAVVGNVMWSVSLPQGSKVTRCGVVTQVSAGQQATAGSLPTSGMTTLSSVVVADVSYTYQPLFTRFITGPITLQRTSFLPPRAGKPSQWVHYDNDNPATNSAVCPGTPVNTTPANTPPANTDSDKDKDKENRGADLNNKGSTENANKKWWWE